MSERVRFVWDDTLTAYDFGPGHPLAPVRVALAVRLVRDLGLLDQGHVQVGSAPYATETDLLRVHTRDYLEAVRACGSGGGVLDLEHGLGTDDNPVFLGMHDAASHVAGATVEAVRSVVEGDAEHAVNLAGGLHHAMPDGAAGFCVYNDVAVGIAWALANGVERVAYVDVDVHHGDGVERVFWDDPRVLTISIHESPRSLFPGTGFSTDVGGPGAEGYAVNVPLPPGTDDSGWLRAFDAVVPPLLEAFQPQLLVTQHGCDSHVLDPLAHLALTVDGQREADLMLHDLAHLHAGGRWVATGGGGYALVAVVPRAWAHLVGVVVDEPVDPSASVPESWRSHVSELTGATAPARMTDGVTPTWKRWSDGYDPDDWLDRAVLATREAVFPVHGLDPQP